MKSIRSLLKKTKPPKIVGRLVAVDLPLFGIEGVVAKVDTGAFSGALHATRIREVTDKQGVARLQFAPLGKARQLVSTDNFHKKRVKSSNGSVSTRYAIDTEVRIAGQIHPMTITLADRGAMKYHMIIGRKFLNSHDFLIDVSQNNQ
jgi:hypothetical protein